MFSEHNPGTELISIDFQPASAAQKYFLASTKRNILFNSGYGAGKTYVGCFKLLALLCKFPKSRAVVGRQKFTDLAKTTRETFFQVCPQPLYDEKNGGARADGRGYLRLINGSEVFFMHFDNLDLRSIKSLEINFLLLDQAEEISESIYLGLDARLGRKSDAEVPQDLIDEFEKIDPFTGDRREWPRNELTGRAIVPVYSFLLINPPDEGELHYLIQRFHPKSEEWKNKWQHLNDYVWSSSRDNIALSKENLENMLSRDPKWVARYVDAEIGQGEGALHLIHESSVIDVEPGFVDFLRKKASLSRILDHGSAAPTCVLWFASHKGFHFCYQEYYVADTLISDHRQNINDLSQSDTYTFNLADPSIFKKSSEKNGGFWSVADEYMDETLDSPALVWLPADNNEFATRNRINELLRFDESLRNPITGKFGSPRLFFIRRSNNTPNGCYNVIRETKGQKMLMLDTVNGRPIYSDERDKNISDHSYDCLRYYCASHLQGRKDPIRKPSANSFLGIVNRMKALKKAQYFDQLGSIQ